MKTPGMLVFALTAVVAGHAQTTTSTTPVPPATTAPKTAPTTSKAVPVPTTKAAPTSKAGATTPAATATKAPATKAPAGKDAAKKEEPKIEGMTIPRGKKFLGLQIVNGTFKLSFYDEKKKPVAADMPRAILRWDPKYKVGKERVVLNISEDGKSLASPRSIRPPYSFKLYITLLKEATEAEEPAGETFVIDFQA